MYEENAVYIVTKRIKHVAGVDKLNKNEKYGKDGLIVFNKFYESFWDASRTMEGYYESMLKAMSSRIIYKDIVDKVSFIVYETDGATYELRYMVETLHKADVSSEES